MTFLKKILAGLLLFVTFLSPISVGAQSSDVLSSTVESLQSIITELTRRVENISATSQTAQVINTTGTSWYVSPTGSSAGDGSQNKPWNFETAINAPTSVKPGDTIWVMGGEYKAGPEGYFRPRLKGAEGSPIIVRAMPGQRVTLIGSLDLGLRNDEYTWWWGFEIKSKRMFSSLQLAGAAVNYGKGVKLINNIIHDNEGGGVALWKNAVGPEAYGNVVYNNGIYTSGNRGSAHGFYIQSFDSGFNRHVISDNIVFRNYNNGLQLSGETPGQYNNVTVEGNTFFNNGELAYNIDSKVNLFAHNWVIAPTGPANNIEVVNNYGYTPSWAPVQRYKAHQLVNSKITGNYMISSGPTTDAALDLLNPSGLTMTGNTMLGLHYRFNESDYPTNTYLSQRPTSGSWVFVRPNKYEAGRGNITIYNWAKSPTVDVDLSKAGLPVNTEYEIRNAQDFFATPVLSGRYSGGTVAVPMSDLSVAAPIQPLNTQPTKTSPEFGAFVVLPKGILPPPTPNPTPTPTPSPVIPNPPVITPPNPTPTPTPTPNTGTLAIGSPVEATEYLNVRSGPSTTNTVIETVTPSTRGIIVDGPQVGSGYTWWKVLFYNNSRPTGWVAQNFLKISSTIYVPPVVTPTPTPTPTPNPTPTPIPVPSPAPVQTGTGQTLYNGIVLPSVWPPKRSATLDVLEPWYVKNPPAVVNIDIGRQLFVDDFLVESTTLSRTQHKPVMHPGNPIIYPPNVGEANIPFGDGVWYDPADSTFKMWYMCPKAYSVQLCYAYSSDGKTWTKHKNNPIFVNTSAGARDSSTIWMDLNDIPSRKFKMFSFTGGKTVQQYFSADGITWVKQPTVIESVSDRTTFFYNPFRQVWVESERDDFYVQNRPERNMTRNRSRNYIETPNPMSWDYSKRVFWMGVDNNDPPYVGTQIYPQLYNFDAIAYESVMLGFRSMYYPEPSPRLVELNLGFSRDGFTWTNPTKGSADKAFIAATNKDGDWNGFNTQSVNGGVIIVGDELYIYFSGRSARHGDAFETHKMGAGLATLRRDGFYSMDAGSSEGVLTTKTLKFSGGNMFVNVNNPNGSLQVEVLDENNNVIAPFTKSNSQVVKTDSTKTSITWNGANLSSLAGKNVKFRFYLTNGKLYSFWVTPSAQGASFGYVAAGGPGFTSDRDTNGVNVPPPTPTPTPVPVPTPTPVPTPVPVPNPVPTPVPNPTPVPVNPVPTPLPIVGSPIITNTTSNRLSSGTRATNISVRTDSQSSCRYSYRADIGFSGMTLAMTSTDGINHQVRVDGLNDDSNYVYYVRCQKNGGLANNIDFKIHLYVSALGGQTSNFSYQLFEAESGSVTSPMKVINDNSASGLAYIKSDISNSGSATYTVNVPTKGVYTLWGRVLSIDGTRDSVLIQVDSQPVDVWDLSENTWSNSWQWSRVTSRNANNGSPSAYNIKPKQISLEAGSHTITISGRDAGAIVDRMLLTNDLAFIASDSSTATITSTNVTPIPPPVPTPTPVTPTPTPTPTPVTPAPTPNPPVITPPTLPVDNTATTLSVGAGIEATAYLNVRSAPSITAPVIETITALTRGVVVEGPQLSNGYTWWKVSFFNNTRPTGWVAQNYIKLASGVVTPTPTPTPTPVPVIPTPVPTPTPISTTTASSGNTLSIEAESGSLVGRMRLLYYGSSVSGENVIRTDTENSGSASYNFNINTSKSYVVWARVLTNSSTQNSLRISIDGNSVDWNIPVTGNSWAWVKVSDQNGSTKIWDMNSGNHSLVVYGMEANTQVDKFIITDDTNWTPSGIKGIVSIDNNSNVALIYATLEQIKAVLQGLLK